MPLFLLTVLSIYTAVHVYAFLKARSAFNFGFISGVALGLFMTIMVFSSLLVRVLEKHGLDPAAQMVSCVGYSWMGFLFLFFTVSLLTDFTRAIIYFIGAYTRTDISRLMPNAKTAFIFPFLLALVLGIYGYFEALNIRPHFVTISSSKLPPSSGRIRLVQISDVHLGLMVRQERLNRIITVIREQNPDILVSTGDFVDGQLDSISDLADSLQAIRPRYGKYTVTGNHEFHAGLQHSREITERAGFKMLRGESVFPAEGISITGVDDRALVRHGIKPSVEESSLLQSLDSTRFRILLKHQPEIRQSSLGLFDLQLSGHTHGGQIFPFRIMVRLFYPYVSGLHDLGKGSSLFVNRGTGTWGPVMRFLTPPEVTVIDLVPSGK